MRITAIRTWVVSIPLSTPYLLSRGGVDAFTNVVTEIEVSDGTVGYGEAVPLSVAGDAWPLSELIGECFAPRLIGEDAGRIEAIVDRLLPLAGNDVGAVAAIDLALWDILGKSTGRPVYALFGGPCSERIGVDFTLGAADPGAMAEKAAEVCRLGFHGVVVKLPCRSVDEDMTRAVAVRRAIPATAGMRIDCNGGYNREDALAFLRGLRAAELEVEFVEQPVAARDLEGMMLCRAVGTPISADESLSSPADALALVAAAACDVMNVKVPKAGGLVQARRIAAIATAAGLPLVVGGGLAFGISRYASQHLAASCTNAAGLLHEGPGPASQALTDEITVPPLPWPTDGAIDIADRVGLGFTMDMLRLARYARSP